MDVCRRPHTKKILSAAHATCTPALSGNVACPYAPRNKHLKPDSLGAAVAGGHQRVDHRAHDRRQASHGRPVGACADRADQARSALFYFRPLLAPCRVAPPHSSAWMPAGADVLESWLRCSSGEQHWLRQGVRRAARGPGHAGGAHRAHHARVRAQDLHPAVPAPLRHRASLGGAQVLCQSSRSASVRCRAGICLSLVLLLLLL